MQSLTCDLWLMDSMAIRQFFAVARIAKPNEEQVRAAVTAAPRRQKQIAILPVTGPLETRPSFLGEAFGMSSYQTIGQVFDNLVNDDSVSAIVMDVASPGGMVYGAQELSDKMYAARGRKPVIAVANPMAASGAYWLASAADRIVATPSADTGSVGVIMQHVDFTQQNEKMGEKVTIIRSSASPYKQEGSGDEPLSEETRKQLQSRVDAIYDKFSSSLARNRGVTVEHVNEHFGKGRLVESGAAMKAGMIDYVGTLDSIVTKLAEGRIRLGNEKAQDNWDAPTRRQEAMQERVARINALTETV